MEAFLTGLQGCGAELALEVRHPQWFEATEAGRLNTLLEGLVMGRVLLDTRPIYDCEDDPQLVSERRKPRVPLQPTVTAPFVLIRYISHPDRDFNRRFMADWVVDLAHWLALGIRVYLFVHCPVEEYSPQNARLLQRLLEEGGVAVDPLPWNLLAPEPTQLGLF